LGIGKLVITCVHVQTHNPNWQSFLCGILFCNLGNVEDSVTILMPLVDATCRIRVNVLIWVFLVKDRVKC